MGHTVSLADSGRFVCCRVLEDVTIERARQFTEDTVAFCHSQHIGCVLYDMRGVRNIETVFRNYRFANEDMACLCVDRAGSIAVVTDPDDRSHDFVETVMRNAGYDVCLFRDYDAAVRWLAQRDQLTHTVQQ